MDCLARIFMCRRCLFGFKTEVIHKFYTDTCYIGTVTGYEEQTKCNRWMDSFNPAKMQKLPEFLFVSLLTFPLFLVSKSVEGQYEMAARDSLVSLT